MFPQEFVSVKVCRLLISVPASNSSQDPEPEMFEMAPVHIFIVMNGSVPSEVNRNKIPIV